MQHLVRRARSKYRKHLADRVDGVLARGDSPAFDALFDRVWPELRWDHRPTARRLWELSAKGPGAGDIVEIGSFLGNSTIFLSAGLAASGRSGVVHAVDPHSESSMTQVPGHAGISEAFVHNVKTYGDWTRVEYHRMRSTDAAAEWSGSPVRLLFIDGLHTYEAVMSDYEAWARFLAPDHVVLFDDFLWPEVEEAVREIVARARGNHFAVRGGQAVLSTSPLPLRVAGLL